MRKLQVVSPYEPAGDQGQAIKKLSEGILKGEKYLTLKGVTGSGKTFTMAKIIEQVQKPTLVISHNKTLAAQLYKEFKNFFPNNAVEYFVSYYDYYQPEAYVPARDLYIEKDTVSCKHAGIDYQDGLYFIEDFNSTNGTYVNEVPLTYKQKLKLSSGDEIRFADVRYRFL